MMFMDIPMAALSVFARAAMARAAAASHKLKAGKVLPPPVVKEPKEAGVSAIRDGSAAQAASGTEPLLEMLPEIDESDGEQLATRLSVLAPTKDANPPNDLYDNEGRQIAVCWQPLFPTQERPYKGAQVRVAHNVFDLE